MFYYKYNNSGLKITDSVRVKNQAGEPADNIEVFRLGNDQGGVLMVSDAVVKLSGNV